MDPTNNTIPKKTIETTTGYKRNKNIFNYQTSHIFGRTKNIFLFEAPWNICYVPKIIDPFTGHEAKGAYIQKYQKIFKQKAFSLFETYIQEYNFIIQNLKIDRKIMEYSKILKLSLDQKQINLFIKNASDELAPIILK